MDNVRFARHHAVDSRNKGSIGIERKLGIAVHTRYQYCFRTYGVNVRIESDSEDLANLGLSVARKALVGRLEIIDNKTTAIDHTFGVFRNVIGALHFENEGQKSGDFENEITFSRTFNSMIRVHVAEKARGWVFVHAGVVGWKGRAIIAPAMSYQGKTTLVSELLTQGAEYYSDEYAVLDEQGKVHPFERDLSVRKDGQVMPVEIPAVTFGSKTAVDPIEVGAVVFTRFENGAGWAPEKLSLGQGILETIPTAIPINFNTEFSLRVLNTAFRRAIIIKSLRGEARDAAQSILSIY